MFRVSNTLITILNVLSLLLSLVALGTSVYIHIHSSSSECEKAIQTPLLMLGVFLFLVSLLGLIGSCCRVSFIMLIYLVVTFILLMGLICFTIFALVVTNKGVGKAVSERGYREYRLGDYSHWLQKYVVNGNNWNEIKSCLNDAKVCSNLGGNGNQKASEFYNKNLSPIQSGCCKPPTYCGFEFKNATFWAVPKKGPAVPDSDCKAWSNDQEELCYNCKSCKGGVLANIKKEWRHLAIFNSCVSIFLIIVYAIGCCAYKNNRSGNKYSRYRGQP